MYARNAASPERIAIGPVILIADGTVQTAGVTVRVLPFGGSEADGLGTTAYSTDGVVLYTPTQAETNYTSFVLIAKKSACIPASVTVVTSESTVSGRVFVGTNSDKTGYTATVSDKSGFSLTPATGLGNQTANITGNLTGSVGSINGVTFPANFGIIGIDINGAVLDVITVSTVDELGASALSANGLEADIANAVAATQALSRLDTMIESDGAGQFRFDTVALSMAPAGGGNQTINVYPVSASTPERVAGTTITFYRNESRSVSVVTDFTLTGLTLQFIIEDSEGTDLLTIANASISRSSQTFTVSIGTPLTATISNYRWALRDITGGTNSVIARGVFSVQEAASV